VKASAIRDRQKLRNAPCSNENRIHDSVVHAIQDHLAQVWIVEKTEKERNSQKDVRDGAGVGRRGLGEEHCLLLSFCIATVVHEYGALVG